MGRFVRLDPFVFNETTTDCTTTLIFTFSFFQNKPPAGSIQDALQTKTEEVRILTQRVDQLLGQSIIDSDSIKVLNKENRELRQQIVDKESKIIDLETKVHEQSTLIEKLEKTISVQAERIAALEKNMEELQRLLTRD
jgi:SMC interacting uncharacterized protein involved in chromosome segregation